MACNSTNNPSSGRGVFLATVLRNELLRADHYRLTAIVQGFPASRPGQFLQVQCRPIEDPVSLNELDWPEGRLPRATQAELTGAEPTLRRPISIGDRRDLPGGSTEIDLIYRVAGSGTRWLGTQRSGAVISLLGPLGNGFAIRPDRPMAVLVGGGVGIPPMLYLAHAMNDAARTAFAFVGARSADHMLVTFIGSARPSPDGQPTACVAEFDAYCTDTSVATDDGSAGYHGLVSDAFLEWLSRHGFAPDDVVVYACGPEMMMRSVADLCLRQGIECQLTLERHMACGMGTCQSCVVKIRDDSPQGWSYKLCCSDGPVFDASLVLW